MIIAGEKRRDMQAWSGLGIGIYILYYIILFYRTRNAAGMHIESVTP